MGLARPTIGGTHGVDVGTKEQGGALGGVVVASEPEVVAVALWGESMLVHPVGKEVGSRFLLTTHTRRFYQLAQKLNDFTI